MDWGPETKQTNLVAFPDARWHRGPDEQGALLGGSRSAAPEQQCPKLELGVKPV